MIPDRKCVICGKMFTPKSSRRSFCYEDHYHPCPICGKPVLTKDTYHLDECCCIKHSRMKAVESIHSNFVEWPCNSSEAKEKRKQTCLEKYGVENVSYSNDIKTKISKRLKEEFKIHPEYREKASQTYFERTGYHHNMQNPEVIQNMKERLIKKYGVSNTFQCSEVKQKIDNTNLLKYGSTTPMQNPDVQARQRKSRSSYQACDGTPLDSLYEVAVYNYCIRNNIPIKRTVKIPFEYEGKQHATFIDFQIDEFLVEVKGSHIMDGYFDNQPGVVPIAKKLELYRDNHVIVVTGQEAAHYFANSNGLNYLDKCPNPLIGVDIDLFQNPKFPYSEDRPKCFYDVKVNGELSCYEAFYDEKMRWEMIRNRIKYVGGFISGKQVLTALNVTRKCKQPSWFSLAYAESLLNKYSVSDIIVDPFAGWGTRHDASVKLGKKYIGCDLNAELVEWHKRKGRNIELADALSFKYEGECDVFICPPYKDTEVYFKGQNTQLSQCEWLDIVRQNVPNAKRYIMVCKIIDHGFEKYIRGVKKNKSHFGINYEYEIVIEN